MLETKMEDNVRQKRYLGMAQPRTLQRSLVEYFSGSMFIWFMLDVWEENWYLEREWRYWMPSLSQLLLNVSKTLFGPAHESGP